MRDDPGLNLNWIAACLAAEYGLNVASVRFLPLGYDLDAAVYEVLARDGTAYFLKVRSGPVHEPGLLVPCALAERGVRNVVAPLPTQSSRLWSSCNGYGAVLYPFICGENAMVAGLSDAQWREFGAALRAVHDSGLEETFRDRVRTETFALPSAALLRRLLVLVWGDGVMIESAAAARLRAFLREQAGQIGSMLERAEALGRALRARAGAFAFVLCHGDIHAANILAGEDGRIHLIDWDGPLIAPRERDLLFVVGSRIARAVAPREEALFFAGYGPVAIDAEALIYYRHERIIEDVGEIGKSVLLDPAPSERARADAAALAMGFFAPGGDIERVETVVRRG